jgi:outer membrane protein OmpA-like peptidoglycan-associated protein
MSDVTGGVIHGASEGGVAGKHPPADPFQFLVGPSTSSEFNTARLRLIPIACWKVENIRFAFDSAFVTPDITTELKHLASLVKEHPGCPLSVFGHADPVGSDGYNKILSGWRATVIYALLVSNTDPGKAVTLWKTVAAQENWGRNQRQTMWTTTGLPPGTPDSQLFQAYMQKLCPKVLQLTPKDFLAQGGDPHGKGDFQGCGEFNPLLIFSTKREREFDQQQDKSKRNDANAPNRRVMVLLFRKGSKIDPGRWPCPRATEGIGGCVGRFWSDGQQRRSTRLPDKDRKFNETEDTFACRFYQRISNRSPCDSMLRIFRIRLYDSAGKSIPFAPFRLTVGGVARPWDRADSDGMVVARDLEIPNRCLIEWGDVPDQKEAGTERKCLYLVNLYLGISEADPETAAHQRLNNLGYHVTPPMANVATFQSDYSKQFGLTADGVLNSRTITAIKKVHDECLPDLNL